MLGRRNILLKVISALIISFSFPLFVFAQGTGTPISVIKEKNTNAPSKTTPIIFPKLKSDSLKFNLCYPDTVILWDLFMPVVFDGQGWDSISFELKSPIKTFSPLSLEKYYPKLFSDKWNQNKLKKNLYRNIIIHHPNLVKYSMKDFPDQVEKTEEIRPNIFQSLFSVEYDIEKTDNNKPERLAPKRKYWFVEKGSNSIQFSQNYISSTWYKGGDQNLNLLSDQYFEVNYRKEKIKFENSFRWRLNFYNYIVENKEKGKKENKLRIGEEQFRIFSNLGLQAVGNWFYSTNIEIRTQFITNSFTDSKEVLSSFLSPLNVNMGILGMRFQKEKQFPNVKGKKLNISADISPLSVQYTYVLNDKVNPQKYGIDEGKKHAIKLGSTINSNFTMNFNKNVQLTSRFKYFISFDKNEDNNRNTNIVEWENKLNMPLNRYFSTTLYLYLRYDDAFTPRPEGGSKWGDLQLNELLSFGFNYAW